MVDGNQASGKVMVSDANGTATWTAATSLTITEADPQVSSTTTNYVPKWNGSTLTDGTIYDNGNVGIGSNAPAYDLDIYKSEVDVNQRIYANDANGIGHLLTGASGGGHVNLIANSSASTYLGIPAGFSGIVTDFTDMVFATGTSNSGTERMRLTTGGNLGIGTTAPGARLEVITDATAATGGLISQFGSTALGGRIRFYDETATLGPKINFNAGNVGQITGSGNIAIMPTGNVGIGTTSPTQAKLVVSGYATYTGLTARYYNSSGANASATSDRNLSAYFSDHIACSELQVFSDARIKTIKGISDSKEDLNTLLGIKITDYTFKDTVGRGTNVYKKVIAQEVEKIYPEAISKITDVVPDIYKIAEINAGRITVANNLKAGEKVKLIFENRTELVEVASADENGFSVNLPDNGKVFVFGREVNDFRTVDYEALSTLNISATQELVKMINQLQSENSDMKNKFSSLSSDVEMLKALMNVSTKAEK